MNYNFSADLKSYLVAIKIDHYGEHVLLDIPFYGGHIRLNFEVRDGFFMNVIGTANVLNDFRVIESLSIEFGTDDVIAEKVALVLNELEKEAYEKRLGSLTVIRVINP